MTNNIFNPDPMLSGLWSKYTEQNEEKFFWKFVKGLVNQWEKDKHSDWRSLVNSRLKLKTLTEDGPVLSSLPEELLPALSKFLFIGRDEIEQGMVNARLASNLTDILKCLVIVCRKTDNIPLVASMDFIKHVTQINTLLMHQLLEMESSFFSQKVKSDVKQTLREEIMKYTEWSCHFLECIYDPFLRWRFFLTSQVSELESEISIPPTPIALHQETIPFLYESFETALADCFPALARELLNIFGAVISGARHNAVLAISPATSKMLLKTVRDTTETSPEVHITAICCSGRSIQLLHEIPFEERQIDIVHLIEQHQQIIKALTNKDSMTLSTLTDSVILIEKMLIVKDSKPLQKLLSQTGLMDTLLSVIKNSQLDSDQKSQLLPIVIGGLCAMMRRCEPASQKFLKIDGYSKLLKAMHDSGPPNQKNISCFLAMSTHGDESKFIQVIDPVLSIIQWLTETEYEDHQLQIWVCESLSSLCSFNIQNKMLCTQNNVLLHLIKALKTRNKLSPNSVIELLKLIESLGTHSISPFELKQLIMLLKDGDQDESKNFSFQSHVIHIVSAMARSDGYEACRNYFDIDRTSGGITIPGINLWTNHVAGFTFHTWIRLDKCEEDNHVRRQLYSLYSSNGNGFEAFFTSNGILVAAVANKKDFLAVSMKDHPLQDEKWHCIQISHIAGKIPFGQSWLTIFVDGTKRLECHLKYPSLTEPISYCQIGTPLHRNNVPALNLSSKPTLKEGIMDAIKIGLPGVLNIPHTLKPGQNDPNLQWTLIGLESQPWGKSIPLCGQLGMVSCFQDAVTSSQAKVLYGLGPNQPLSQNSDDNSDVVDLFNRLVFLYSARASQNNICPNLHTPGKYDAQVFTNCHSTQDVKDVINCIGGVQVLFPLLETATGNYDAKGLEYCPTEAKRSSIHGKSDWEMLPSSSFSDWKLEQNAISGFLTLIKNLVMNHTLNTEQLMRGGGVSIIGSLLQRAKPKLIDVNVLMAAQLLVELAQSSKDQKLLLQIYQSVLFEFRIWSKSEFHVQIGQVQYLSTIIKDDRKFFRKKFGVQYLLDVIRKYYNNNQVLSPEDSKTIRSALLGLVRFFLLRDVTAKDVYPIVAFMIAEKNEILVREMSEMLAHYLATKSVQDQMLLIFYESKKGDLLHCLLIEKDFQSGLRRSVLRLMIMILRTTRVSGRHKIRMSLNDCFLGFLHLYFKRDNIPKEEVLLLMDEISISEDAGCYQAILGLVHHLQYSWIQTKLEAARKIMTCLFSRPDVPYMFAKQIGWQECLCRLLVRKVVKPDVDLNISDVSIDDTGHEASPLLSPTHIIEVATNTAKQYLPQPASDAVEYLGSTVGSMATKVITGTSQKVSSNVSTAHDLVSDAVLQTQGRMTRKMHSAQEKVSSKTQEILGKVQSGFDDLSERASFSKRRKSSIASSSANDDTISVGESRPYTPQFLQAYDQFGFEDLTLDAKSVSSSSDDISIARVTDTSHGSDEADVLPDMEIINETLINEEMKKMSLVTSDDKEEELCQLVINILFTIMWRGMQGSDPGTKKERGQVIACINMLGLNNELYKSHVDLKRRLVELCVQAALSDLQDGSPQVSAEKNALALHVMQWVYDLVVLDPHGDFGKKVSEILLDGILALMEKLAVFQDGNEETEWEYMGKMAFEVLLKCVEDSEDIEICTMAIAKLHALVQTRTGSNKQENAFLIMRVERVIKKFLSKDDLDHYSFIAPVMKALLEKSKEQLNVSTQLPSLNLRSPNPTFFDNFKDYCGGDEWNYFIEKKVSPLYASYLSGVLTSLPREMDVFWAECYEASKIAIHKRSREVGESKIKFINRYLEHYQQGIKTENNRFNNVLSQQNSHLSFIRKRWENSKRLFFGPRGAWHSQSNEEKEYWKISNNENFLRMRLKLIPNPNFDPHLAASAHRDNVKVNLGHQPDLLQLQLSKDALRSLDHTVTDSLTEDDLKVIAKEQFETANESSDHEKLTERLVMSEDCELVTYMSVVRGKFELTTNFVYFFDSSPFREDEDRYDFRWSLNQLREMHFRRFNLRRSGIEFFLLNQTNYFLNFTNNRRRNKVYSKVIGMKPLNLVNSNSGNRSPADWLKASGLVQKWVHRDITNFEYLMQLNTIAGRTLNDLSQYPVFPWILADYDSQTLDLTNEKSFRDLRKPIGIQNQDHEEEVRMRYENFEDPAGVISKFHYGTHYSNSAMVLHYLVRVEPFTSLHIDLQSGRFDVADRQFHSIHQTWKSLMENLNDVKELIPEFFYFPEFLQNLNGFDLGKQQGKKKSLNDVMLPNWAKNPDDFIRKHRLALESEYVSANLHHWIDLIFGYKQRGPEAVKALNVFYYCSYESAVNLDAVTDPAEREAIEGMINNFGQTPCQLLIDPHPKRMSLSEYRNAIFNSKQGVKTDMFLFTNLWKPFVMELTNEKDPLLCIQVPKLQYKSYTHSDTLVTISANSLTLGLHNWSPMDKSGSGFTLDRDISMTPGSKSNRKLPPLLTPKLNISRKLFAVSPDAKYIFSGGHWDNSLQVYHIAKAKTVSTVTRHIDVITCLSFDHTGAFIITGSRDTTSIVWEVSPYTQANTGKGVDSQPNPKPLQVLSGHDKAVNCVAISTELDMAVSGSEDGSINVYTVKEGQYIRSIFPPTFGSAVYTISQLNLSYQGHIVFTGHSRDVHSLHVYTINGHLLTSSSVSHRITAINLTSDRILTGDENGDLILRDLLTPKIYKTLPLQLPIQDVSIVNGNSHILLALRDGKVIIIGLDSSGNISGKI